MQFANDTTTSRIGNLDQCASKHKSQPVGAPYSYTYVRAGELIVVQDPLTNYDSATRNQTSTAPLRVDRMVLALLLVHSHLDEDEGWIYSLVEAEGHAAIWVHGGGGEKLHVVVLGQDPLAEAWGGLGEGLDLWSWDLVVVLELLAHLLAVCLEVFLNVLLGHWDLVEIESDGLVNHVVDELGTIIEVVTATSEFVSAADINRTAGVLLVCQEFMSWHHHAFISVWQHDTDRYCCA